MFEIDTLPSRYVIHVNRYVQIVVLFQSTNTETRATVKEMVPCVPETFL